MLCLDKTADDLAAAAGVDAVALADFFADANVAAEVDLAAEIPLLKLMLILFLGWRDHFHANTDTGSFPGW